jgi:hypothetical protein
MQVIMGEMRKIGWILVATARPPLINVPIDAATDRLVIEAFLSDLRQAAAQARGSSPVTREKLSY